MEPPHAAESARFMAAAPELLEIAQPLGQGNLVPFVGDIQERAAFRASGYHLLHAVRGTARGRNTFLIGVRLKWHGRVACG